MNERNLTFNLLDPNQIRLTLCYTNCSLNIGSKSTHLFVKVVIIPTARYITYYSLEREHIVTAHLVTVNLIETSILPTPTYKAPNAR